MLFRSLSHHWWKTLAQSRNQAAAAPLPPPSLTSAVTQGFAVSFDEIHRLPRSSSAPGCYKAPGGEETSSRGRCEGGAQPRRRRSEEGSSGCEPGGGLAQSSHGAAAADSPLASFVFISSTPCRFRVLLLVSFIRWLIILSSSPASTDAPFCLWQLVEFILLDVVSSVFPDFLACFSFSRF